MIYDVVIIGAGISGFIIATECQKKNLSYIIVEKSKNVGGRIAARRFDGVSFDYGLEDVDNHVQEDLEAYFKVPFSHPLNNWSKEIGSRFEIINGYRVQSLSRTEDGWKVGDKYEGRKVVMTMPSRQTYDLLKTCDHELPKLLEVDYESAIFYFAYNPRIQDHDQFEMLYQQRDLFKYEYLGEFRDEKREELKAEFDKLFEPDESFCHKWRYCVPKSKLSEKIQVRFTSEGILMCGDYFIKQGVEGSFLSSLYLREFL